MLLTRGLPPPVTHFVPPDAGADAYQARMTARLTALRAASRPPALLADEALLLHCQEVVRLGAATDAPMLIDISVRLWGEEDQQAAPGAFLALIEDDRLMAALDRRLIERALDWCSGARPAREVILNVGVSQDSLLDPGFPAFVAEAIGERELDPRVLCLEVAESVAGRLPQSALPGIAALARTGCGFAVGASTCGSGSLAAMRALRAKFVRIAGALVRDLLESAPVAARVAALQRVCRAAGVHTVAECVECPSALQRLEELGVGYAQGAAFDDLQPLTFVG
ncbi:MAG: EAL domain-containing protein [Burkholderiales bacterium]|nr:EAL domain-containing protein [Burkholderiales bacterium]